MDSEYKRRTLAPGYAWAKSPYFLEAAFPSAMDNYLEDDLLLRFRLSCDTGLGILSDEFGWDLLDAMRGYDEGGVSGGYTGDIVNADIEGREDSDGGEGDGNGDDDDGDDEDEDEDEDKGQDEDELALVVALGEEKEQEKQERQEEEDEDGDIENIFNWNDYVVGDGYEVEKEENREEHGEDEDRVDVVPMGADGGVEDSKNSDDNEEKDHHGSGEIGRGGGSDGGDYGGKEKEKDSYLQQEPRLSNNTSNRKDSALTKMNEGDFAAANHTAASPIGACLQVPMFRSTNGVKRKASFSLLDKGKEKRNRKPPTYFGDPVLWKRIHFTKTGDIQRIVIR